MCNRRRRRLDGGHGREVLGLGMLSIVVMGVVEGHSRRRLWGATYGDVDDGRLVDVLAAGEVGVERRAHVLLRPQGAVLALAGIA